ncbi:Bug family tripartite tricarboxylate transporter substrate binding protein [Caenimonas aquaedulcis]|uniref:Tripartite tricarboxylate transporter substrate binding protein n=1 Tax=Caenimonas aquaedulcis TaxID=2793270 RepID=A0A931H888_9BURK|nr:tripartite tricarboxylate transporter substrate binding protein [Caenimonas aquaedulcis]MBG9390431.1 tripartite tricarboxylate transporter substrate binding protein [Caenimonas aquaedulcis]
MNLPDLRAPRNPSRRAAIATLVAALAWPGAGIAQAFPARPLRVVVPFPAGSSPDVIARFWGERLGKSLGQPVVIDNKPGASTIIGAQAVAAAPADGHTLLYTVNNTTSINPFIYKTLPYKSEDFVPVVRLLSVPYVLVVSANSPVKSLQDLIAAAKAQPGRLNYASYGIGQGTHVAMAWFLNAAGVSMTHVPYKDGGLLDVMAGTVAASFEPSTTAIPQVKAGKLRALAVSGPKRVDALPGIPAVAESVPGFLGDSWQGIFAPRGTPPEAVAKLAALSREIVASEEFRQKLHELGLNPAGGSPADFAAFLADDARAWSKVVADNGIKAE